LEYCALLIVPGADQPAEDPETLQKTQTTMRKPSTAGYAARGIVRFARKGAKGVGKVAGGRRKKRDDMTGCKDVDFDNMGRMRADSMAGAIK
jgi:hypothetical protein